MPELECVGGPLDGQLKHFYGEEFPWVDDVRLVDPLLPPAPGPARTGRYAVAPNYRSPITGIRRTVWLWRPPRGIAAA